ncbi:MAG: ABC transporter permease [Ignisphaera sp.]|uniref:ABC transporter permease subunit n=1 Tax=Ignisphaera aggregans TaxID=334771 RepID=A0A7C4NLV7_9CREN
MINVETIETITRSLWISATATLIASLWSMPMAFTLALRRRTVFVEAILEALVGIPAVLLGLILYLLFSSSGPLAFLKLLYTPFAIVIGESLLITPLITSACYRGVRNILKDLRELGLSLGASRFQLLELYIRETYPAVIASIIMGFSRAVGELGIALMVGGNIAGFTRTMTTAIALDVAKGEFEEAIVLGLTLLSTSILASIAVKFITRVDKNDYRVE